MTPVRPRVTPGEPRPMRKLATNNMQIGDLDVVADRFPEGVGLFQRRSRHQRTDVRAQCTGVLGAR